MRRQQRQKRVRRLAARRAAQRRRGVLLLVVLSLLTLFLMIATAFLISAGQFRRANRSLAALAEDAANSVSRADFLDEVVGQLLRDTNNADSSLRFHSLLRDLYGNDGLVLDLPIDTMNFGVQRLALTGNQVVELSVQYAQNPGLSQLDDYYNGRVMTFANGDLRGESVRVIDYIVNNSAVPAITCRFRLLWTQTPRTTPPPAPLDDPTLPNPGDRIVINGAPFNGTGVGYDLTAGEPGFPMPPPPPEAILARLTAGEALRPDVDPGVNDNYYETALTPNTSFFLPQNTNIADYLGFAPAGTTQSEAWNSLTALQRAEIEALGYTGWGGSDESYDAVDYQNMALARLPVNPIESVAAGSASLSFTDPITNVTQEMVIPSFHRPALLNYWVNEPTASLPTNPLLLRKAMIRPSWFDHPDFTGSNPDLEQAVRDFAVALRSGGDVEPPSRVLLQNMTYGPWDVDNDGDGIRDSVWVDFGAPVIQGANGKRVKPLAAILCVDMDGRLNINAHGSKDLAGPVSFNQQLANDSTGNPVFSDTLPHGLGYGPADISLAPVVNPLNPTAPVVETPFARLLLGLDNLPGRYGWDGPVGAPLAPADRAPGETFAGGGLQQAEDSYDLIARVRMFQAPLIADTAQLSAYATPPDFSARYALGLNALGQPVYEAFAEQGVYNRLISDSPYEIDLSENAPRGFGENGEGVGIDAPFSLAEMERVLRAYDTDAGSLPSRIWELADGFAPTGSTLNIDELNRWRTLLTTDSYDLPTPATVVPRWMLEGPDSMIPDDDYAFVMGDPDGSGGVILRRPVGATFADLLEYRVRLALNLDGTNIDAPGNRARVRGHMATLLPPELASGQKLDINRPLGNGVDDDGNGVVDEPYEGLALAPTQADGSPWVRVAGIGVGGFPPNAGVRKQIPPTYNSNNTVFWPVMLPVADLNNSSMLDVDGSGQLDPNDFNYVDRNGDGQLTSADALDPGQTMARHLYVLAMTLVDPLPANSPQADRQRRARQLAQWAVNCVDFRDANSVMTAFEYDVNPFDGWDVDGVFEGVRIRRDPANPALTLEVNGSFTSPDDMEDFRGVVFGAERPELLITETLAWHDRNTEDLGGPGAEQPNLGESPTTIQDPNDGETDRDYDQRYRPKGAFFLELYNPWPSTPGVNGDTHALQIRRTQVVDDGVNLAAEASDGSPVWRLAIYKTLPGADEQQIAENAVESMAWDPDAPTQATDPESVLRPSQPMDRSVYFRNVTTDGNAAFEAAELASMDQQDGVEFFTSLQVPSVRPGRFLVVGSGDLQAGQYVAKVGLNARGGQGTRSVVLDPNNSAQPILYREPDGTDVAPVDVQQATSGLTPVRFEDPSRSIADVAVIDQAVEGNNAVERRLTVSEPAAGYPDVTEDGIRWDPDAGDDGTGWYGLGTRSVAIDTPLDDQRAAGNPQPGSWRDGEQRLALQSLVNNNQTTGLVPNFSRVYLQRLANPTLPFHPQANPYLTVDAMSVNVTVFNGRSAQAAAGAAAGEQVWSAAYGPQQEADNNISPSDVNAQQIEFRNSEAAPYFASLQRGYRNFENPSINAAPTPWATEFPTVTPRGVQGQQNRANAGENSLMPSPVSRMPTPQNGRHVFSAMADATLGFMGRPFLAANVDNNPNARQQFNYDPNPTLQMQPNNPYAWLAWNNRPFASAAEVMQVPKNRSSQLLNTYTDRTTVNASERPEAYEPRATGGRLPTWMGGVSTTLPNPVRDSLKTLDGPFGHLPNFFLETDTSGGSRVDGAIAGLHRVLNYLGTTSPYVGTETWLNPATFNAAPTSVDDPRSLLQPPHNRVPTYRDPGRVNLNTIVNADVWDGGILQRQKVDPTLPWDPAANQYVLDPPTDAFNVNIGFGGPFYQDTDPAATAPQFAPTVSLVDTRRGYNSTTGSPLELNGNVPTFFANPFRQPDAAENVPLDAEANRLLWTAADASLLRSENPTPGPTAASSGQPVFAFRNPDAAHNNGDRNSYFRYQPMTRMAGLTTTRSNVYAVWVTIGFFEVEEAPTLQDFETANGLAVSPINNPDPNNKALYDRVYPDGYALGREEGSDLGAEQRVRGFYMIDRTIPVAFEPGEAHNTERAVRLQRRIE